MKTLVVVQARMGSSRLPGKVLRELGASVTLDWVVRRCRAIRGATEVIVATSTAQGDAAIETWCREHGVTCFRGSEDDVLARFYECAKPRSPDVVARVTADCPFLDFEQASDLVAAIGQGGIDFAVMEDEDAQPRGLSAELLTFATLEQLHRIGFEPRHREHVTSYAYERPDEFRWSRRPIPSALRHPELRLTLDTDDDYALCRAVADRFAGDPLVPARDIVRMLLQHPELARLNAHVLQKSVV